MNRRDFLQLMGVGLLAPCLPAPAPEGVVLMNWSPAEPVTFEIYCFDEFGKQVAATVTWRMNGFINAAGAYRVSVDHEQRVRYIKPVIMGPRA